MLRNTLRAEQPSDTMRQKDQKRTISKWFEWKARSVQTTRFAQVSFARRAALAGSLQLRFKAYTTTKPYECCDKKLKERWTNWCQDGKVEKNRKRTLAAGLKKLCAGKDAEVIAQCLIFLNTKPGRFKCSFPPRGPWRFFSLRKSAWSFFFFYY